MICMSCGRECGDYTNRLQDFVLCDDCYEYEDSADCTPSREVAETNETNETIHILKVVELLGLDIESFIGFDVVNDEIVLHFQEEI